MGISLRKEYKALHNLLYIGCADSFGDMAACKRRYALERMDLYKHVGNEGFCRTYVDDDVFCVAIEADSRNRWTCIS